MGRIGAEGQEANVISGERAPLRKGRGEMPPVTEMLPTVAVDCGTWLRAMNIHSHVAVLSVWGFNKRSFTV